MVDPFFYEKILNGGINKFRTIITSDSSDWKLDENFYSFDKIDELRGCFGFHPEEADPSEPCKVINNHKNVFLMMKTFYSGWFTKINM